MKQVREAAPSAFHRPDPSDLSARPGPRVSTPLSVRQLNLLRVGYLFMGGGLALVKWPLFVDHGPWDLKDGTVQCLLVAMSFLALLGVRYPVRMLPVLLFEVAWKLIWLGVIALPLWSDDELVGATREQAVILLLVVVIIAVIPWGQVVSRYVLAPGDPWRRRRVAPGGDDHTELRP